jgi:hypothetical protein
MPNRQPLNERQIDVLRWIAQECPSGVWSEDDFSYKVSSNVLGNRGLADVDRRRGKWSATITDAGRYYLEHLAYPPIVGSQVAANGTQMPPEPVLKAPSSSPRAPAQRPIAKSDQLVTDVIAADGRLEVISKDGQPNYGLLVQHAIRRGAVPEGKLLKLESGGGWGKWVVTLTDAPEWMSVDLAPIAIAETLRKAHPAIARLRKDRDRLRLRPAVQARVLRVLDALAKAAEVQGFCMSINRNDNGYSRSGWSKSVLIFERLTHEFGIEVAEVLKKVPHEPTQTELRRAERDSWYRIPRNDDVATGTVKFSIDRGVPYRQSTWTDDGAEAMELRLAEMLQELCLRADDAEEKRLEREREEQERQRRWEEAMERAKERLQEANRAQTLVRQLADWQTATALAEYLDAMSKVVAAMPEGDPRIEAKAWLRWSTTYAAQLNPLSGTIAVPVDVEATHDNLKPFLDGWSSYGPQQYW